MDIYQASRTPTSLLPLCILGLFLAACGGGGGGGGDSANGGGVTASYTVSGTVSGLAGSGLVLRLNGNNISVANNGQVTFAPALSSSTAYAVTVFEQPGNPTQTCTVSHGSGAAQTSNVTDVAIDCKTNTYTVSVKVSGLDGAGLVLRNNAGDDLAIPSNGQNSHKPGKILTCSPTTDATCSLLTKIKQWIEEGAYNTDVITENCP